MASDGVVCPVCGASVAPDSLICSSCHSPLPEPEEAVLAAVEAEADGEAAPTASTATTAGDEPARPRPVPPRRAATPNPFAAELTRRLSRLSQWEENVESLGVEIPRLPPWAEEAARAAPNPEPWAEVVREVERIAQKRILQSFDDWEKKTRGRLTRLEAYAVDSRLERDQIEDALHAARSGDIAQALATYRQVDRVVAIKERHLDQAREELERVVSLLKDMAALGIDPPQDPTETAEDLEAELRAGKLAALKQQIRALRLQAVGRLKAYLPRYISEYGDYLVDERTHGIATEREAMELARGARDFFKGRPEEGLRRLRALQETHGMPTGRARPTGGRSAAPR